MLSARWSSYVKSRSQKTRNEKLFVSCYPSLAHVWIEGTFHTNTLFLPSVKLSSCVILHLGFLLVVVLLVLLFLVLLLLVLLLDSRCLLRSIDMALKQCALAETNVEVPSHLLKGFRGHPILSYRSWTPRSKISRAGLSETWVCLIHPGAYQNTQNPLKSL